MWDIEDEEAEQKLAEIMSEAKSKPDEDGILTYRRARPPPPQAYMFLTNTRFRPKRVFVAFT